MDFSNTCKTAGLHTLRSEIHTILTCPIQNTNKKKKLGVNLQIMNILHRTIYHTALVCVRITESMILILKTYTHPLRCWNSTDAGFNAKKCHWWSILSRAPDGGRKIYKEKKENNVLAKCITVIVIFTITFGTLAWIEAGFVQKHKEIPPYVYTETMPLQLDGCESKHYKDESDGVMENENVEKSITISQTKVSFFKSAAGKLIQMRMIGILISTAPVRYLLSPRFNISPFLSVWCLTEWKPRQYFLLTKSLIEVHKKNETDLWTCGSQYFASIPISY